MNNNLNFSPGPSQLYFTAEMHMHKAFRKGIPSISHRSKAFEALYQHTTEQIRALLNIPLSHRILFMGSATEIWERTIQNLVEKTSLHLVNGAFSEKFYNVAIALKKHAQKIQVDDGKGFDEVPETKAELIAVTHNETSTGVALPNAFLYTLKDKNPHALIAVDAVSSLPYSNFEYAKLDSVYFSIQKGFGLPPGLGVWIVNDRCIAKAENLLAGGHSLGAHYALDSLLAYDKKYQTPNTPNTLAIYMLGKVAEDMLKKGIEVIRKETEYKAALLYHALQDHSQLTTFVNEKNFQSPTVILAKIPEKAQRIAQLFFSKGTTVGCGYGVHKNHHLRIANFPTHSKEQFEHLVDLLQMV